MSKIFEICSATYNIALNHDEDDVFRTGCTHLYHFLQGNGNQCKSGVYKPMMLKMHLELNELIEETEGQIAEPSNSNNPERQFIQQLEAKFQSLEDSLQARDEVVNKLIAGIEKNLEKNLSNIIDNKLADVSKNAIAQETNNALLRISDNAPRLSAQQLEEKLKTLEDALQANNVDAVHKIIERMEKLENNLLRNIENDHKSNNDLLTSPGNTQRPSDQYLEAKLKTLEESLQAKDDVVNKIIERLEKKLENIVHKATDIGNYTIDHVSSDNVPIKSTLQLEAKLKTLEDSLQAKDDVVNKIMECMEKLENNISKNVVDKTPDVGNNTIDHESNNAARQSVQQLEKEVKDLKDRIEQLELNKAINETIDCKEYQTTPKEKKEIQFDKDNLVVIWPVKSSDSSLETAIHNVIKYAKEMDLSLTSDQIKHIDVRILDKNILAYYVFFRTRTIKEAFLMKSDILRGSPHSLKIVNESEYNTVYIRNFKSSDLDYDSAIANVIGLANQMGFTLMDDQIRTLNVFRVNQSSSVCRVELYTTEMENEFLNKSHILKELPATKSFEIY